MKEVEKYRIGYADISLVTWQPRDRSGEWSGEAVVTDHKARGVLDYKVHPKEKYYESEEALIIALKEAISLRVENAAN